MSLARLDWSTSVRSRFAWAFLLCAVALGIVGMHGLVQGGDTAPSVGHHVSQTVDLVAAADAPDVPVISDDSSPRENPGLLTLCLMVLAPAVAVGLWLLVRSRLGGWQPPRVVVRAVVATNVAVPPPPLWRRATVLRI